MTIPVPAPDHTRRSDENFAIECALGALLSEAAKRERIEQRGLMYLPTQELARNFQAACRDILDALRQPPEPAD